MMLALRRPQRYIIPQHHRMPNNQSSDDRRIPLCSEICTGSVTVEAALGVPLFFFAVLVLFYMMEVMSIRTAIRSGMQYAAREACEEIYGKPYVSAGSLESDIIQSIGEARLDRSVVEGGSGGISCEGSRMSAVTGILTLNVRYQVRLPVSVFTVSPVRMEESMRMKGWNGYVRPVFPEEDEETVYVTENGIVYHRDYHCHYLDLSIHMVPASQIGDLRNASQGKYYACERCAGRRASGKVYVTDYGDRYHSSLSCSGLKRTVYAIPLSEAAGKGACSKCCK